MYHILNSFPFKYSLGLFLLADECPISEFGVSSSGENNAWRFARLFCSFLSHFPCISSIDLREPLYGLGAPFVYVKAIY